MKRSTRVLSLVLAMLMLFSVFSVAISAKEIEVAETGVTMTGGEVLYLKPNSNWTQANARYAIYVFGSGNAWASMTECANDKGIYKATVPSGSWTNVIFCRMNPGTTANDWNNKWNQTGDLVYDGTKNLFTVPSGAWDNSTSGWSVFTETGAETQPAETEPTEPEATDPEATEPEATEPEATEPEATEPLLPPVAQTVYCINSNKWDAVSAHAWNDSGDGTTWPGLAMTKTGETVNGFDVYEITFEGYLYTNVIFNNNDNGSQTENLDFNEGQYYDVKSGTWYASLDEVPQVDPLTTDRYIAGSFNGWSTSKNEFKLNAEGERTGYLTLTLEAETKYEFKVVREGTWTSCATPITGTVADLTFSSSVSDNATITTTVAGDYVFSFGLDSSKLAVTYPEAPTEPETEPTEPETEPTEPETEPTEPETEPTEPETEPTEPETEPTEPETEPVEPAQTITVYFENNWMWPEVSFYYWGTDADPEWPGIVLTEVVSTTEAGYDVYKVEVSSNITGMIFSGEGSYGRDQSKDITEIKDGYCYYMTYDDATGEKPCGSYPYVEPTTPSEPEIEKVEKVSGVSATANNTNSFTVTWDAVEGAEAYWVFVDGACYGSTTETTITVDGRKVDTEYEVYVLAAYADNTMTPASAANVVAVSTKAYTYDSNATSDAYSVTVNWEADSFEKGWIYFGTDADDLKVYDALTAGEAYVREGLKSDTTYYYKLAYVIDGKFVDTNEVIEVKTTTDANLVVNAEAVDGNLELTWNTVNDANKYWVFVETADGSITYSTTDTALTLEGFEASEYTITVKGANANGQMVYYYPVEA